MRVRTLLAALALLVAAACGASGQTWQTLTLTRQRHGERALRLDVEYGAGEFSVGPGTPGMLYRAELKYDADRFDLRREFDRRGDVATLRLGLRTKDGISLRGLKRAGSLALELGPDVPTELELDFGAGEAEIELGGLHLTALSVETGASDTRLNFSRPNAAVIERCSFQAGVAAFRVEGLGKARCARVEFEGGVGDVLLDFGGAWSRSSDAKVRMGVGSLTIRIPDAVGVSIQKKSFLASFSAAGLRREADRWVSENWETAPHRLTISIEAAIGSVNVERTRGG